jgi:hypothetical protein
VSNYTSGLLYPKEANSVATKKGALDGPQILSESFREYRISEVGTPKLRRSYFRKVLTAVNSSSRISNTKCCLLLICVHSFSPVPQPCLFALRLSTVEFASLHPVGYPRDICLQSHHCTLSQHVHLYQVWALKILHKSKIYLTPTCNGINESRLGAQTTRLMLL